MDSRVPGHLGPRLSAKPMHMFWLLDVSGSMSVDGKIDSLNDAMVEAIKAVQDAVKENPGVQVIARVITFANDAEWHGGDPIDIEDFEWSRIEVVEKGTTELGLAIDLATDAIRVIAASGRGLPPALILVSDGRPTDLKAPSFGAALRRLADEPWAKKASRVAIGIGKDADMEALHRFINHDEILPIRASNAAELTHYLRWASTVVVDEKTRPAFGWDSELDGQDEPVIPRTDTQDVASNSSAVVRDTEANLPTQPPRGMPRDLPPPKAVANQGREEDPRAPKPRTDRQEAATEPFGGAVEKTPAESSPRIYPQEAPTELASPRPSRSKGAPTSKLPLPGGATPPMDHNLHGRSDGTPTISADDTPTLPIEIENDAKGGTAETVPSAPSPPKGVRRTDLPPAPGVESPAPPEPPEGGGPEW